MPMTQKPLNMLEWQPSGSFSDVEQVADTLFQKKSHSDPIWTNAARDLFFSLSVFACHQGKTSLNEVITLAKKLDLIPWLKTTISQVPLSEDNLNRLENFLAMDERFQCHVLATFFTFLSEHQEIAHASMC